MGYAFVISPCVFCKKIFSYNPLKVPSVKVDGVKEPICATCLEWANRERVKNGLEPWGPPLPGAYEPCREEELP